MVIAFPLNERWEQRSYHTRLAKVPAKVFVCKSPLQDICFHKPCCGCKHLHLLFERTVWRVETMLVKSKQADITLILSSYYFSSGPGPLLVLELDCERRITSAISVRLICVDCFSTCNEEQLQKSSNCRSNSLKKKSFSLGSAPEK